MSIKKILIVFKLVLASSLCCQTKFVVSGDVFGRRVFIKNNGQFDSSISNNTHKILYGYVNGDEQVYFTNQGLHYVLVERKKVNEREREALEHGKKIKRDLVKKCVVNVTWENRNTNIEVIESEKQNWYHSFGDAKFKSDCYKKITYKNVYNNIDIECVFTGDKQDGVKYNVIVHPRGDVNAIKIKYSGDVEKLKLKNGNVIIKTPLMNVSELAPQSFQNGQKIESNFTLNNNLIGFNLPNGFNATQDLIIDPWVVNLTLATNNYGYDVDFDYAGNYYVYGGSGPFLISKYSPVGNLLWTFNGVVPSQGWSSLGTTINSPMPSNFLVDRVTGKSYMGQAFAIIGTRVVRVDQNGIYDNFISIADSLWIECWDMAYDCGNSSVMVLGGSTKSNKSAGILNTVTGAIIPQNFTGGISFVSQDIVSHAIDPNGNVFFLFASLGNTSVNNLLTRVNTTFNGNMWMANTTYFTFFEAYNKFYPGTPFGFWPTGFNSNGFNALAADANYLYCYDGFNLAAYSKTTGAKIAFTTIASQTELEQGGIAVDDCDNVYVGGNGSILCYNFNGNTFTPNSSIPIGSTTALKYVTDIKYNAATNELYVCGSGFAGIYTAINSVNCNSITINTSCVGGGIATASITSTLVNPLVSYTWTNASGAIVSQTNNSSLLSNTVTGLANGNYTVTAHLNAPCGAIKTQTININCALCDITAVATTSCAGSSISTSLTVGPSYGFTATTNYSWAGPNGFTANTSNAVNSSPGVYTLTAVTPGCSASSTVLVTPPSVFTPVITTTQVPCYNTATGAANISSITGTSTAPYTYSWTSIPIQTSVLASNLAAGNYTCFVTDANGCSYSASVSITQPPPLLVSIALSSSIACINNTITLNAITLGGTGNNYSYQWSTSATSNSINISQQTAGLYNYIVTVVDANQCSVSAVTSLSFITNPNPFLTAASKTICSGDFTSLNVSGASNYTWSPSYALNTVFGNAVTASPMVTTVYTVNGYTQTCLSTTNVTVTVVQYPNIQITCPNQQICSEAFTQIFASGAQNYSWSPSTNISSTSANSVNVSPPVSTEYTLVGYNTLGTSTCSVKHMIPISVIPKVVPFVTENKVICLGKKATFNAGGGNTYSWSPDYGLNTTIGSGVVSSASLNTLYTVTISQNGDCPKTATVGLIVNPLPQVFAGSDTCYNLDDQMVIKAIGTGTINWISGDNIRCNDCPTTEIKPKQSGYYLAQTTNEYGCKANDDVFICVTNEFGIYVPNSFTPNGDGLNDTFAAYGHSITEFKLDIFDRWGENIFTSNDIKNGWNGLYKGEECKLDVYIYKIAYKGLDAKYRIKTGHITLER